MSLGVKSGCVFHLNGNNYGVTSAQYNGPIVRRVSPRAAGGSEALRDESGTGLRCGASPPLNHFLCLQTYPGIFFFFLDHMVGMDEAQSCLTLLTVWAAHCVRQMQRHV